MKKEKERLLLQQFICLKKLWLIMKILTLLLMIGTLQIGATGFSQNHGIDLSVNNSTLGEVIKSIEAQSDYRFLYRSEVIGEPVANFEIRGRQITDVLDMLSKSSNIKYQILEDNLIVLAKTSAKLQQNLVRGIVTSETGEPLPGVNIVIDGTTKGTVTDINGQYELELSEGDNALVFSYVGYLSETMPVNGHSEINISLIPDLKKLDEVVVIGYGYVKRSDLTGSVASVEAEDISKQPITDISQAMKGKVSGVEVFTNDAAPGGTTTMRIRGHGSLGTSNDPLYIIDGYIGGDLNSVNPLDIESIEILKDASATAIYGARGGNGVVLITTKRGQAGKNQISVSHYTSFKNIANKIEVANAQEYMEFINASRTNAGSQPLYTEEMMAEIGKGTDWQDALYKSGMAHSYNINYSGGNEKTTFAIMGNYSEEDGIVKNADYRNLNARINLDHKASSRIKLGANIAASRTLRHFILNDGKHGWDTGPVTSALRYLPIYPVKDSLGNYYSDNLNDNPVAAVEQYKRELTTTGVFVKTYGNVEILKGLIFNVDVGADFRNNVGNEYDPVGMLASNGDGQARIDLSNSSKWLGTMTLNYSRSFDNHDISLLGGIEQQVSNWEGYGMNSTMFSNNLFTYFNLNAHLPEGGITASNNYSKTVIQSAFFRLNYNLLNRYLITGTVRRDGSSRFGPDNKWGTFPSAAVAWKIHNEDFMANINLIDELKLRLSWGKSGNDRIPPYQSIPQIEPGAPHSSYIFGEQETRYQGAAIVVIPNTGIKWETSTIQNIGLDLGLFNHRLRFTGEVYQRETTDLLWRVYLAGSSGYNDYHVPGSVISNIGSVMNKGVELQLGSDNFIGKFKWSTDFNISFNENEVLDIGENESFLVTSKYKSSQIHQITVGEPIGNFYGHKTNGLWQTEEEIENNPSAKTAQPGDIRYVDVDGDGEIKTIDKTVIGNALPVFTWGLTNNLSYSNFDLYVFIYGSYGNDVFNANKVDLETQNGRFNISKDMVDHWTAPGDDSNYPAPSIRSKVPYFSDRYIEDGTFARLANIQLAYNLPAGLLNTLKIQNAKIYVSGQNLLLFTKYSGYDPEVNIEGDNSSSMQRNLALGIDYSGYPGVKTITLGINLTF